MLRTFDSVVMQVLFEPPAFLKQQVAKALDLLHDARSFPRANVEPNPRATLYLRSLDKTADEQLVPPHRGRERGDFSKNGRVLQPKIKRDKRSEEHTSELQSRGHLVCR